MMTEYIEAGGNSIDTANIYTNGHSEKIIGDYLAARRGLRDRLVLGTKFFANFHIGDPNGGGPSRKAILSQVEDSLRRLQTDYVDMLWLHTSTRRHRGKKRCARSTNLVASGKVRYVGFSDIPAWATAEAAVTANFRGWVPITAIQIEYSLLERTSEGELLPMAQSLEMGALAWGPLKSGWLSGKFSSTTSPGPVDTARGELVGQPTSDQYAVIDFVNQHAADLGLSAAQVSLAWVRQQAGITSTLIGARRTDQLKANIESLKVELPAEILTSLSAISAPHLNFPAGNNTHLAPMLQFGGATVDGVRHAPYQSLLSSNTRY